MTGVDHWRPDQFGFSKVTASTAEWQVDACPLSAKVGGMIG
jgi:hypothetical protein